jgi:Zn-dependent peptidase ImmA (M78 family)
VSLSRISGAARIKIIENSSISRLADGEDGRCFRIDKMWYIIYDDMLGLEYQRFAAAHELGHIFLGHGQTGGRSPPKARGRPHREFDADLFALELLAPSCIVQRWEPERIAELCRIPLSCIEKMKITYIEENFLGSPLKRALYNQFKKYVKK